MGEPIIDWDKLHRLCDEVIRNRPVTHLADIDWVKALPDVLDKALNLVHEDNSDAEGGQRGFKYEGRDWEVSVREDAVICHLQVFSLLPDEPEDTRRPEGEAPVLEIVVQSWHPWWKKFLATKTQKGRESRSGGDEPATL